jgi:hypothetical protein
VVIGRSDLPIAPAVFGLHPSPLTPTATTMFFDRGQWRLPPELCDMIIDFCAADTDQLRTCALVCRQWLPSSRMHLFHGISLNDRTTSRWLEVITSNNRIASFVQSLEIRNEESLYSEEFSQVLALMGKHTRPRVLILHLRVPCEIYLDIVAKNKLLFLNVSVIRIAGQPSSQQGSSAIVHTFEAFAQFICSFQMLRKLEISLNTRDIRLQELQASQSSIRLLRVPPGLHTIHFKDGCKEMLYRSFSLWLTEHKVPLKTFRGGSRLMNRSYMNFIDGKTLENLSIHSRCAPFYFPFSSSSDLMLTL